MSDTKYTDLDIHQAIDLVKSGCPDVQRLFTKTKIRDDKEMIIDKDCPFFINAKYRIETSKLKEWNDRFLCPNCKGQGYHRFTLLDCPDCNGTGKTIDDKEVLNK